MPRIWASKLQKLRSKFKGRRQSAKPSILTITTANIKQEPERETRATTAVPATNPQLASDYIQKLPLEIRKLVYRQLWRTHGPGYHVFVDNGRLTHAFCVMNTLDEDPDFIQKQMDLSRESDLPLDGQQARMEMWYGRLISIWGHRHWRCEERIVNGGHLYPDLLNTLPLMLVCKRICPEIIQSIFESQTFTFNDLSSAHRFFVLKPPPFIQHLRYVDMTLNMSWGDYSSFIFGNSELMEKSRLVAVQKALAQIDYLHELRISFDIWDRHCWRKIPEQTITRALNCINAKKLVVEFPAALHIWQNHAGMKLLEEASFDIERRPPLRYWKFDPRKIEHLHWKASDKADGSCWIETEDGSYTPSPYM